MDEADAIHCPDKCRESVARIDEWFPTQRDQSLASSLPIFSEREVRRVMIRSFHKKTYDINIA